MKKIFFCFTLLCTQTMLCAFTLEELAKNLQQPSTVQGQFVQKRFIPSLNKPMTTRGQFTLLMKKGLLWQMQKPFENTLRVNSDGIMQWNGQAWFWSHQDKMYQNHQVQLFLDLFSGNMRGLQKQFQLQLSGNEKKWTLRLVPQTAVVKQVFETIVMSGNEVIHQIEWVQTQGERTVMRLDKVQVNQPMSAFAKQYL